jgi:hypothetical protein
VSLVSAEEAGDYHVRSACLTGGFTVSEMVRAPLIIVIQNGNVNPAGILVPALEFIESAIPRPCRPRGAAVLEGDQLDTGSLDQRRDERRVGRLFLRSGIIDHD